MRGTATAAALLVLTSAATAQAPRLTVAQVVERLAQSTDAAPASFAGADLSGLVLEGIDFKRANLTGTNLTGAKLAGSDFFSCDLTDAVLEGADLKKANLDGTTLRRANLSKADLRGREPLRHDHRERQPQWRRPARHQDHRLPAGAPP